MKIKVISLLGLCFLLIVFSSCKTHEKLVYFQSSKTDTLTAIQNHQPVFKTDDLLSIDISADDNEAVKPFKLSASGESASSESGSGNGYLIDANGMITLPIVGNLHVAGLKQMEATLLIEKELEPYINNPIVQIQILNYKVTVLGDVANPGTYEIPNARVTILEALGYAGDLNITGNRKNVLVIRDENGVKTEYRLDLTSKDIYSSPVFYLSQNDVVYVEPNFTARSNSTIWRTSGSVLISTLAVLSSTLSLIIK